MHRNFILLSIGQVHRICQDIHDYYCLDYQQSRYQETLVIHKKEVTISNTIILISSME